MKIADIAGERVVSISTIKSQMNQLLKKFKKKRTKEIITMIEKLKLSYLFDLEELLQLEVITTLYNRIRRAVV